MLKCYSWSGLLLPISMVKVLVMEWFLCAGESILLTLGRERKLFRESFCELVPSRLRSTRHVGDLNDTAELVECLF